MASRWPENQEKLNILCLYHLAHYNAHGVNENGGIYKFDGNHQINNVFNTIL